MHKKMLYISLICFALVQSHCHSLPYRAFCKSSVADIVSAPFEREDSTYERIKNQYGNLPASWGPERIDQLACPRIHQLLLHEIVIVLEESSYEAHIEIASLIAARDGSTFRPVQGWILKEHLSKLNDEYSSFLPPPIEWKSGIICDDEHCVALVSPFVDTDQRLYSAGTRFVLTREVGDNFYAIAFDKQLNNFKEISIPQALCAYQPVMDPYDKRMLFCTLVGLWSEIPDLAIPLVWGGASIGAAYEKSDYYLAERHTESGQTLHIWDRPRTGFSTLMGIDASNLVSRAAQLVGIPYFWKNSFTASLMLDELAANEYPLTGDLIWVPGGLLILSDVEQNIVITAMSYTAGYGTLVKLPLEAVFQNITTVDDLLAARNTGSALTVLNRDGSVARIAEEFKILKLM